LTGAKTAEGEGADASPAEGEDGVADSFQHSANHALAAGMHRKFNQRAVLAAAQEAHPRGAGGPIIQHYALFELVESGPRWAAFHFGLVYLIHVVPGMGEAIGEFAVVGDEQQSLGIGIEAAGRVEALSEFAQQFEDRLAAAMIGHCGEGTARLVQEEIASGLELDGASIQLDPRPLRVNEKGGVGGHFAVNANAAGADQVGRLAARGQPRSSDEL